jgi:protein involved in polysaccharide export with SLBB domain
MTYLLKSACILLNAVPQTFLNLLFNNAESSRSLSGLVLSKTEVTEANRRYGSAQPTLVGLLLLALAQPAFAADTDPTGVGQIINSAINPGSTSAPAPTAPAPSPYAPAPLYTPPGIQTVAPATPVPPVTPQPPQYFDYQANLMSDIFGANLFSGAFAREGAARFNPDYLIAVGDHIQLKLWGAFEYDAQLTVDPQGNLFIPHVGPVRVTGVRNQTLQLLVDDAVKRVFRANVKSYASLAAAQPVRVFVSGNVNRPGLYEGTSLDSLLHYVDQAGGIDLERGSFLDVSVRRGGTTRASVNLYDFILEGRIPQIQLADGDVIFIAPRQHSVKVGGLVGNAKRFEFRDGEHSVADIARLAKPQAQATHARITRNTGTIKNVEYYPLADAPQITLHNGDDIEFTADKKQGSITVRVEGEHQNAQEYVVPYGTRLGSLMQQIRYTDRADKSSVQLFRKSVKERQKLMLDTALKRLESAVLTVRSGTLEEAQLRKEEAALMLQWIERARAIEPSGQVLLAHGDNIGGLLLEGGDIVRIPAIDNLVLVSGEVMFPNTVAIAAGKGVDDYIKTAGGYSQNADTSRIIIAHKDGSFEDTGESGGWFSADSKIRPGDEILVLPKVDGKYRQLFKEVSQMVYQMALGARVILN